MLEPRTLLAAAPIITEIMAVNNSTLADEDGDYSDWLEIYNSGDMAVDLDGWYLTDDDDALDKWSFPPLTLQPLQYVIVFASDKNRSVAGNELHANFKLSGSGEYLALVQPDGFTIAHEYAPEFPEQFSAVSYGPEQTALVSQFVTAGDPVRVLLPASAGEDVDTAVWSDPSFDDSGWLSLNTGIGYDADGDFAPFIDANGDVNAMQHNTASAYVRSTFDIPGSVPDLDLLELPIRFDDGFVAYLNGSEVARRNAPASLKWDATAAAEHGGLLAEVDYGDFSAPVTGDFTANGSASFVGDRLRITPASGSLAGAAWTNTPLPFGANYSFTSFMAIDVHTPGGGSDADGTGADGMTFTLQSSGNNALGNAGGALGLDGAGMTFVAIEFDTWVGGAFDPDATLPTHIGIDTSLDGNIARVGVPRFNGGAPGENVRYAWVDYDGLTDQMDVYFSDTATKPAVPTLSANVDLAGLFAGVTELYAGWTAGTGGAINAHDVLEWEMSTGAGDLGLKAEKIDISQHANLLQTGTNVLAIHGLNVTVDDEDFLVSPELIGTDYQTVQLNDLKYFSTPSPGGPNGTGTDAPAGPVSFSQENGTFANSLSLQLSVASPTATIRYTTDGSLPDETSTVYSGNIQLTTSTRIRARAFDSGRVPGPVRSGVFIALDSSVTDFQGGGAAFQSNLPLIVLDSFTAGNAETEATLLVLPAGVFIQAKDTSVAAINGIPDYSGRLGMRIRGQTSQGFAKKPYALETWGEGHSDTMPIHAHDAEDSAASFFELPPDSDWVLNGPYSDKTQLNNFLTFMWSAEMGQYAPRVKLVEVFVNSDNGLVSYPGDYRGTYVLMEKIKVSNDRVDVTNLSPADNSEPEISGGYIWKKDKPGAGDIPFTTNSGQQLRHVEPGDDVITPAQTAWLTNYLNEFEGALYGANFTDPELGYEAYIDVNSWVDTWLLVEFTKNIDGFRLSTYYHKDRGGKIKQGPAWDYNLSLGNANYGTGAFYDSWYHDILNNDNYPYWRRLFEDPDFVQAIIDRWYELRTDLFSDTSLLADIDASVFQLTNGNPDPRVGDQTNPISRNFTKWSSGSYGTDIYHWPNCFFGVGSCPASPLGGAPTYYMDTIAISKWFVQNRAAWIDSRYVTAPTVVTSGTDVTITAPSGVIYYTLDGSDPRGDGGVIASGAIEYTGSFSVQDNTVVTARAFDTSHLIAETTFWSAPATGGVLLQTPRLAITEINYHPHDADADEAAAIGLDQQYIDSDNFEFLEIRNIGATSVNLVGTRISDGIAYTFPALQLGAGEYVVVAKDLLHFEARYGEGIALPTTYAGNLANGGEMIELLDLLGNTLLQVTYNDSGNWPARADGHASTLELIDVSGDANAAVNWRASTEYAGSPGATGIGPFVDIVVNEVLSHTDLPSVDSIELYNASIHTVDIGGWYLSDSWNNYRKFQIPANTILVPGQLVVFDEDDFNSPPANPNNFALNSFRGDEVWLMAADGNDDLVRFADQVDFGAAVNGETFGRVINSAGKAFLYPQQQETLGAVNGNVRVGPVIISEIMYAPDDPGTGADPADLEFVEIYNPGPSAVNLTNWQLEGGVDYDFPNNAMLGTGATLLILRFDPAAPANAPRLAAFRDHYGIDAGVPLAGGYSGKLSNEGERVTLRRPDTPPAEALAFIPLLLEDEVQYETKAPWPTQALATDLSITRGCDEAWGNEPQNWSARPATPGTASFTCDGTVLRRGVFYNNSAFAFDDAAMAYDKVPLFAGDPVSSWHYTNYAKGLNGVIVELRPAGVVGLGDFQFHVGNAETPTDWQTAPAPVDFQVQLGVGLAGSNRYAITWNDGDIQNQWLQITVEANAATTGLAANDVFYFGNASGEAGIPGDSALVNSFDFARVRDGASLYVDRNSWIDINRDSMVDGTDLAITRDAANSFLTALRFVALPAHPPAATIFESNAATNQDGGDWGLDQPPNVRAAVQSTNSAARIEKRTGLFTKTAVPADEETLDGLLHVLAEATVMAMPGHGRQERGAAVNDEAYHEVFAQLE